MKERNTIFILLITTVMIFGYHFSNKIHVKNSQTLIKDHHADLSMGLQKTNPGNEATLKDWDHLFDKIIDTDTGKNPKKPFL